MKPRRFIVCSDIHGNMQDPVAIKAILSFIDDFNPEIRVINGDLYDFASLRKGASDEDRALSLRDDIDAGNKFAEQFFKHGKENYFLRGNHDERLYHLATNTTGLVRDYAQDGIRDHA